MSFRKNGNRKLKTRIFIYGDGITEFYYSKHIHNLKYSGLNIEIKRSNFSKSQNISKLKRKISSEISGIDAAALFIFDVENSPYKIESIIKAFEGLIKKEKIIVIFSNPSIEYWFLLHYEDTNRKFEANELKRYLLKHIENYSTSENFLSKEKWAKNLIERLDFALNNSKKYTDKCSSYTNFYKIFEKLNKMEY